MTKHTPGPWVVNEMTSGHYVETQTSAQDGYITEIGKVNRWKDASEEAAANARLIAAAPDLLEALQDLIGWIPNADALQRMGFHTDAPTKAHAKARAAIAKAIGDQQ